MIQNHFLAAEETKESQIKVTQKVAIESPPLSPSPSPSVCLAPTKTELKYGFHLIVEQEPIYHKPTDGNHTGRCLGSVLVFVS